MMRKYCLSFFILLILNFPSALISQEIGYGVVISAIEDANKINHLLFPTLYAYQPFTDTFDTAQTGNYALVIESTLEDNDTQILHLRDDLRWSDGHPITAYDVLYSLISQIVANEKYFQTAIHSVRILDNNHIALTYTTPIGCSTIPHSNMVIYPVHALEPNFVSIINAHQQKTPGAIEIESLLSVYYPNVIPPRSLNMLSLLPTAGPFTISERRPDGQIRMVNGPIAWINIPAPRALTSTQLFMTEQINLLLDAPPQQWADIQNQTGILTSNQSGFAWDYIVFNLSDPLYPRSAYNDMGELIEQLPHPILTDVRVRQAIQRAINIPEIITTVFYNNATPLAANLPPASWAYNADLAPIDFQLAEAERLLDAAGWRDINQDGIRECYGCQGHTEGQPLFLNMAVQYLPEDPLRLQIADRIYQHLIRVGIEINIYGDNGLGQDFDLFLGSFNNEEAITGHDPDQSLLFTRVGDRLMQMGNIGSYYNPQVEALFEQARTVSNCNKTERAAIYRQIQAILQEDQPYVWLYIRHDTAASRGIKGFAPLPSNPLWNIDEWIIAR